MRKIKNVFIILLLLSLSVSTAYLAYLHFFASGNEDLSGEWTANLDMKKEAAAAAFVWLQDIEAVDISLEEMESYMQNLTIQVDLRFGQTGDSAGVFQCKVLPESYNTCRQAAYEAFAAVFQELLAERLRMAGYTGGTDKEALEALAVETFGMSTVSYLMLYGPALLPSLEELQAGYDGSGFYEAAEGVLIRYYDAGGPIATKTERYIRKDGSLILSAETGWAGQDPFFDHYPVIYNLTLQQPQQSE